MTLNFNSRSFDKPTNGAQICFNAVYGESGVSWNSAVTTLELHSGTLNATPKAQNRPKPIKQSGQTAQSECKQHARKRRCVQKQTGGKKPHSMWPHKYHPHQHKTTLTEQRHSCSIGSKLLDL